MPKWKPSGNQWRWRKLLRCWQHPLLGLYALLLAGVFPFICWGGVADQHHPHRLPHFVFLEPIDPIHALLTPDLRNLSPALSGPEELHHAHRHDLGALADAWAPATQAPLPPAGRATPALVIFSLLLLIFYPALILAHRAEPYFIRQATQPFPASVILSVPHPPPRRA
jgi:hypothetical protein